MSAEREERAAIALHGLSVAGDLNLAAFRVPVGTSPDLQVHVAPAEPIPAGAPSGELVAALDLPGVRYWATLAGSTLRIRFEATADFEVDLDRGAVSARAAPGREGMLGVLFAGNVIALVLGLRGVPVLHAGAVLHDGRVTAFAGPSGAGKSTLTMLACRAGGLLVTDDSARIDLADGAPPAVHRGPATVRLRGPATALAAGSGWEAAKSADARTVIRPPAVADSPLALDRLAFPTWSDTATAPRATPLGARATLQRLLGCARVAGWLAPEPLRANFECSVALAGAVEGLLLELPRGRLADPGLPAALVAALEEAR